MKTLGKSLCCLGLLVGLTGIASAAEIQGVLMDKMCSMKAMKEGQQAAQMHTRDCALMPDCQKSGYGVFTADGRFISLDGAGNAKALAALKASNKKDDLKVQVTGEIQGETIKVASLKLL
jgi:hypothetical protein